MKALISINSLPKVTVALLFMFLFSTNIDAQTKRIKRPSSRVGATNIDNFVRESFDIYDKVYKYDGYAKAGTPLDDDDIDVLEEALAEVTVLTESTPNILSDLDGLSMLKKGKATLQVNKAQKALRYSMKTAKELLFGEKSDDEVEDDDDDDEEEEMIDDSNNQNDDDSIDANENASDKLEVYSKFDFVPGDKLIYFDDFSQDFIGDFPSKWNTNGTGEVVKLSKAEGNWFEMKAGYNIMYIPLISDKLPEEYTIEFDLFTQGLGKQTSSTARLNITIEDQNGFAPSQNKVQASIPFGQYGAFSIHVSNTDTAERKINSALNADIRNDVINQPHISIAVNKKRFRLWVNETKYVDIPQFIYNPEKIGFLKFNLYGLRDGEDRIFIQNLKIAEGGLDLRRQLMAEGRVSTNGILFDSGSANIKSQSYGIIRQISQVLMQDENMKLNIIGHTDADGTDDANLKLSKARADAVKQALIEVYKISEDRLTTEGKGESEPVGDNATADGKAQNRRVEFVKH